MAEQLTKLSDDLLAQVTGGRYTGPTFVYEFQPGDSLYMLARRYNTTVQVLQDLNGIQDAKMLGSGIRLLIPQR